jgi:hypothetical protein
MTLWLLTEAESSSDMPVTITTQHSLIFQKSVIVGVDALMTVTVQV